MPTAPFPTTLLRPAAIAHGGVGVSPALSDGCRRAVDAALRVLADGGDPLDAAVAGVVILEDDPRFNAGTGSWVRFDGQTVQMDASVMDSGGRFGAVAAIERVQNPVKVARALVETPHLLLAGEGATRFARTLGLPEYDPATPERRERTAKLLARLLADDPTLPEEWRRFDVRKHWNFARPFTEVAQAAAPAKGEPVAIDRTSDTVGVVVRAADGRFAAALSTGGTAMNLDGRIGDVPIYGAGLYASGFGASAATGTGERIVEAGLARLVNAWLEGGASPQQAAERAVEHLRARGEIGIITLSTDGMGAAASHQLAWAGREEGGPFHGP